MLGKCLVLLLRCTSVNRFSVLLLEYGHCRRSHNANDM